MNGWTGVKLKEASPAHDSEKIQKDSGHRMSATLSGIYRQRAATTCRVRKRDPKVPNHVTSALL